MGELDALILPEHPRSDTETGAAHACVQCANCRDVRCSVRTC